MSGKMQYSNANRIWKRDLKVAATAGFSVVAVIVIGSLLIGFVNGGEAKIYVESIISTSRYLCSAVMTATATILALMLTLLSLSLKSSAEMKDAHYLRVQRIAFYDALVLSIATGWLMLHCIPVADSNDVPSWWFPVLYYALLVMAALLGGGLVAVVVMLYTTIRDLIEKVCLEDSRDDKDETSDTKPTSENSSTCDSDHQSVGIVEASN